ncbi:conserved exported hypothetical protein [Hyphomicrobium sp. GJ21]|jgi:hypothetical protein|uniref:hypothetical protein n=1 Tax=Hyphomicrobium sp. GJ21 TaxID=113574 RepID=UPI000622C251|nr:hypothetical protein [Hyphomicrobium sp. GJ21]MBN9353981.1 hypothetical protein [Hyphomicrobium denitrificans]CEJ88359.1 conserved exported hypothetical protein [Hyphomicrobium sp. GJ21]
MPLKSYAKALLLAPLGVAVLAVSGCGFDGVQLNGKIFDAVGLNDTSAPKEPKLAARQPLVVPPGLEALPPPGSGKPNQPELAVQDVDAKKGVSKAELQRQQEAYCKVNYEDAKARGDATADSASGPLGSCHPSILTGVKKWMASGSSDEGDDDTQTQ